MSQSKYGQIVELWLDNHDGLSVPLTNYDTV